MQSKGPKEINTILTETLGEHAPSYATNKTGWPSLNVVVFPPVMRLSRRSKTVTTPEIIDQIHELILEDRQILCKSIAEQLRI